MTAHACYSETATLPHPRCLCGQGSTEECLHAGPQECGHFDACHPNLVADHCHTGEAQGIICVKGGIGCTRSHYGIPPRRMRGPKPRHAGEWWELIRTVGVLVTITLQTIILYKVWLGR